MLIDQTIVSRYRKNYGCGEDVGPEEVEKHKLLEAGLTRELLESTPEERWAIFEHCYSRLYTELPWLNNAPPPEAAQFMGWLRLVPEKAVIFEIGSGRATLLKLLAANGRTCVATEITRERGAIHAEDQPGLTWKTTDGINLSQFEAPGSYDVLISTQVAEHFHPDDLGVHLRSARELLKPSGRYIFDTPHRGTGPHDLSLVFDMDVASFMHLKEYDFVGLGRALKRAGYRDIKAIFVMGPIGPTPSRLYYLYSYFVDAVFRTLKLKPRLEKRLRRLMRRAAPPGNIWLSAAR